MKQKKFNKLNLCLYASGLTVMSLPVFAQETDISNLPLFHSTGQVVAPNIQFIIDDSGSMAWEYAPDALPNEKNYCKEARTVNNRGGYSTKTRCVEGEAPYYNSHINTIFYNPEVKYDPVKLPENYTPSHNLIGQQMNAVNTYNWRSVPEDIYRVSSTGTTNLTNAFRGTIWCSDTSNIENCVTDQDYSLPDNTFKYMRNVSTNAHYYTLEAGEYCSDRQMKNCISSKTPTATHTIPAFIRFCTNSTLSNCQKNYVEGSYTYARYSQMGAQGERATGGITITSPNSRATINEIYVGNEKINVSPITGDTSSNIVAERIVVSINNSNTGYFATRSGNAVTIRAPNQSTSTNGLSIRLVYADSRSHIVMFQNFSGGKNSNVAPGIFRRVDIVPNGNYYRYPNRTDCAGDTCTYDEEMTNFANWYVYYRTRMNLIKSTVASTLGNLNNNYRLGIFSLNNNISDVKINNLSDQQRNLFLNTLFSTRASGGTPLRQALAKAGNIYQGKFSNNDPVQYSCQQNFTIMATDGYWNGGSSGYTGPKYGGNTSVLSPFYSPNNRDEVTLADIAYYYYYTDLRPEGARNPAGINVSDNNVPTSSNNTIEGDFANWQHMTTFTLGLGLSGILDFDESYKTSNGGDYFALKQGTVNWPKVISDQQTTIDDLWHTAINGHGQYFSAKDPSSVTKGLVEALSSISVTTGTGAAAATSNLEPIAGDNFVYVASYRTRWWDGDLAAYTIDLNNGTLANLPVWSSQELLNRRINVHGTVDTRKIYTDDVKGNRTRLVDFTRNNLSLSQQASLDPQQLSQWYSWTGREKGLIGVNEMVDYIRGHSYYEDRNKTGDATNAPKLLRARENILGDIINAKPEYVGAPNKRYADEGYNEFKLAMANRQKTVFVAANDGMLHAFNAENGEELWAYIPSDVIGKLYKLADISYANTHEFFTDGAPVTADIYDEETETWRTILVAGFNSGSKGYFALDVTDPTRPRSLWKLSDRDASFGFTYGRPIIAKNQDGEWRVFLSSGYNNTSGEGDGKGWLYEVDPMTGEIEEEITTNIGSRATPSGFAKFNTWVNDIITDNKVDTIYGGDLLGNMFKFDMKLDHARAHLMFNVGKPISVIPELGLINRDRVIMFSTGKFLGQTDVTNRDTNYIFAIKDDMRNETVTNIFEKLQHQEVAEATATTRSGATNLVDWTKKYGWYVRMKDFGERGNIDPLLQLGTLTVVTNVPISEACSPSGYSWMYQFNYKHGTAVVKAGEVNNIVGEKLNSTTVGLNIVRLPNGTVVILRSRADTIKPDTTTMKIGTTGGNVKRVYWRQLQE